MRATSMISLFALVLVVLSVGAVSAQTRERFVISAKAGGINLVSGRTRMHAQGSSEWEQLTIKDNLEAGDVVRTGVDGRVEMLLNPGSYLRVAGDSEFELTDNSLDNLEVRLIRGTAIVEATGADNTRLMINLTTPHTKVAIVRRGLYRVNVLPGDATELIVRKGRVLLIDPNIEIKGGKKLVFSGPTYSVAKLEKADKEKDMFEVWSKERAQEVARVNRRITYRDVSMMLASVPETYPRSIWGAFGMWFFSPRFGCYTFLPFQLGWGSPYGNSYSNPLFGGYYGGRHGGYYPGIVNNPSSNPGSGSPSGGGPGLSSNPGGTMMPSPAPSMPAPSRDMSSPGGGVQVSPQVRRDP